MRARWAILSCNIKVVLREVDLKNKPSSLYKYSPKGTVPILITSQGEIIDESIDIIKWALESKNYTSENIISLKKFSSEIYNLIKQNDQDFKYHLDRYKYPNRFCIESNKYHQEKAREILIIWNNNIKKSKQNESSNQGWLLGKEETIADWCIWPFVRQYKNINPLEFENDNSLEDLDCWLDSYIKNDVFQVLMRKYSPWTEAIQDLIYP